MISLNCLKLLFKICGYSFIRKARICIFIKNSIYKVYIVCAKVSDLLRLTLCEKRINPFHLIHLGLGGLEEQTPVSALQQEDTATATEASSSQQTAPEDTAAARDQTGKKRNNLFFLVKF